MEKRPRGITQAALDDVGESNVKSEAKSGRTFEVLDNGVQRVDLIPQKFILEHLLQGCLIEPYPIF